MYGVPDSYSIWGDYSICDDDCLYPDSNSTWVWVSLMSRVPITTRSSLTSFDMWAANILALSLLTGEATRSGVGACALGLSYCLYWTATRQSSLKWPVLQQPKHRGSSLHFRMSFPLQLCLLGVWSSSHFVLFWFWLACCCWPWVQQQHKPGHSASFSWTIKPVSKPTPAPNPTPTWWLHW